MPSDRELHEQESRRLDAMTLEQAEAEISRKVYEACLLFERMENRGKVRGNGHHMAQNMAKQAADLMRERWVDAGANGG